MSSNLVEAKHSSTDLNLNDPHSSKNTEGMYDDEDDTIILGVS